MSLSDNCKKALLNIAEGLDSVLTNPAIDQQKATEAAMNALVEVSTKPSAGRIFGSFVRNSYLSSLTVPTINIVSNALSTVLQPIVKVAAGRPVEAIAMMKGISTGFQEAFPRFAWAINPKNLEEVRLLNTEAAKFGYDISTNKKLEYAATLPQNLVLAIDQMFQTTLQRMKLNELVYRIENKYPDSYFTSKGTTRDQLVDELKRIPFMPGDKQISRVLENSYPDLAQQLKDFASEATFQQPFGTDPFSKLASGLTKMREDNPALNVIVPFIKTPVNVLKEASSYFPILGAALRAPYLKTSERIAEQKVVRAEELLNKAKNRLSTASSESAKQNASNDVIRYNKALAEAQGSLEYAKENGSRLFGKQMLGLGLTLSTIGMVESDKITGHYGKDPGEREAQQTSGKPEMSVKIGDTWVSYAKLEPLATVVGSIVDYYQTAKKGKITGKEPELMDFASSVIQNFTDKTFTQQLYEMMKAVQEPDKGDAFVRFAAGLTTFTVPGIVAQAARTVDPVQRETAAESFPERVGNVLQARIPGLRQELPARYNLLGEEKLSSPNTLSTLTGIQIKEVDTNPVRALFDNPALVAKRMTQDLYGLKMTPEQRSFVEQKSGELTQQIVSNLANNKEFTNLPEAMQAIVIKKQITAARKAIRGQMLGGLLQDPENMLKFQQEVRRKKGVVEE